MKQKNKEKLLWLVAMTVALVGATTIIAAIVSLAMAIADYLE